MYLQMKPNRWSCAPTAFAMAVGIPVKDFIATIGHDGDEIIFPDLPEPMRRRGFHSQELIAVCLHHKRSATPIEFCPMLAPSSGELPCRRVWHNHEHRFKHLALTRQGVIEGVGKHCRHAVAFDRGTIFDPDGSTYTYYDCHKRGFTPQRLWLIERTKT